MNVRSKLSLASACGLLTLLAVIYLGGRWILRQTFQEAERALLAAVPSLRQTLEAELEQLALLAADRATLPEARALLAGNGQAAEPDAATLARLGLNLWLVADTNGGIVAARLRPETEQERLAAPDPSIARHLRPDSPLMGALTSREPVKGVLVPAEGPMLVAAAGVRMKNAADGAPAPGVLLVGRSLRDARVIHRVTAGIAGRADIRPQIEMAAPDTGAAGAPRAGAPVRENIELPAAGLFRPGRPLEMRLPVYDIYGRPAFAIRIGPRRTLQGVAELALSWLTLLVAATGIASLVPLLLIQGHTVLNPLTRLAKELEPFKDGVPRGRRLGWRRHDEFGVVATAIDAILDAFDRAQQEMAAGYERIRALLAANPDLIFVFDRHGNILDVSMPGDERMAALFPEPVEGRNIRQVEGVAPEVAESLTRLLAEAIDSGRIQLFEYNMQRSSGAIFWAEARIVRMAGDRALAIVRDITAQRHAQREHALIEARMARAQKIESLGVLAGGLAHDYNNILTAMLNHVDVAMRETSSPAGREAIGNIRHAMLRASMLTRQMLAYAGQGSFTFRPTDLNRLLQDAVRLVRTSLSPHATLDVEPGVNLPLVEADETQICQVAMNLLLNASDALAGSVGRITVRTAHVTPPAAELETYLALSPLKPGDYAMIEVRDTGHGMDECTLERVFDPFFTTKAVGRGLGLSAVLGIVRAHHGGISVASAPRQGTCIRILLPAARNERGEVLFSPQPPPAADRHEEEQATPPSPGAPPAQPGRTMLVVEDDESIRRMIGRILQREGHDVLPAADGEEALALFAQHRDRISLVLLDLTLPGRSGIETLDALRAMAPSLPVIITSGHSESETRAGLARRQVAGILVKPFGGADLLALVAACLTGADAVRGKGAAPEENDNRP